MPPHAVVTGAFSFLGAAVARELRARGWTVSTLTNRRPPAGVDPCLRVEPLRFEPAHLERVLDRADLLVNTYWVRLPAHGATFDQAVARSTLLVEAAVRARVRRLVHVSVSNAAAGRTLGYYDGKARVDEVVRRSGLGHAIVRPTLVVGPGDVLTSNIAWLLRRLPLFLLPGAGRCRLQPVTLDDAARVVAGAAAAGADLDLDAAGPEILSFAEYVALVARAVGRRPWLAPAPRGLTLAALRLLSALLHDDLLTREELLGLEQELLVSRAPPTGASSVSAWLLAHGAGLGHRYVNDRRRRVGAERHAPLVTA